jgi:hypothetical protein
MKMPKQHGKESRQHIKNVKKQRKNAQAPCEKVAIT